MLDAFSLIMLDVITLLEKHYYFLSLAGIDSFKPVATVPGRL